MVANRGEIARRVIRGAQAMGLRCVAVYVDADADAPYVREADVAMRLSTSYLDGEAILAAAKMSSVEAIHPGYGFLSENGDFAANVEAAGLVFGVLDIPGHSPGHVVFVHEGTPIQVFGGDVLFRGSVGRSDLPGGNHLLLLKNIEEKLFTLPGDCTVYPGHGPETTIGYEKETNPFF